MSNLIFTSGNYTNSRYPMDNHYSLLLNLHFRIWLQHRIFIQYCANEICLLCSLWIVRKIVRNFRMKRQDLFSAECSEKAMILKIIKICAHENWDYWKNRLLQYKFNVQLLLTKQEVCMGESWLTSWVQTKAVRSVHMTEVKIPLHRSTKLE